MSHEIEIVDGKASMAYVGEVPWHGLGVRVPADLSSDQMLETAGLNWEIEKRDLITHSSEAYADPIVIEDRMALIRTSDDKILDIVGLDWNPLQNSEAFEFFNEFVKTGNMSMHTAGSLDGGRIVWGLAKVNRSFEVVKGDVVDQYLLFTNPHKYGKSIDVRFTPIRVVCNNTLTFALNSYNQDSVRVNHRQKFDAENVKKTMGIADEKFDRYEEAAQYLASKNYNQKTLEEYIKEIFPTSSEKKEFSRPGQTVLEYMEVQPGHELAEGSWWNAFNGVTFAVDHLLGNSQETRLRSAWYGVNANKKNRALELALEKAEAA